jgi:hypothetical protein
MSFGEQFLRFPDLFPGRPSGEPWGDRALLLDVAGGPYLLAGLAPAQEEAARHRFGALCQPARPAQEEAARHRFGALCQPARPARPAEAGDPQVVLRMFRAPAADFLAVDTRGWEYALDFAPAAASLAVAGLRLMARLDWPVDWGGEGGGDRAGALSAAVWTSEAAGEEWASVCENCLRVVVAHRLLAAGGAVLHSAGVVDRGRGPGEERAFLLLGPSGAGKTTASRLCLAAGGDVLSDDLNAVRFPDAGGAPDSAAARLAKLPFTGDLGDRAGGPESVPLRAILRLAKCGEGVPEGLRPLSPAAALASLLAAAPFVNRDPWRRDALLAVLERLVRAVPAFEVSFTPGGELWSILRSIAG